MTRRRSGRLSAGLSRSSCVGDAIPRPAQLTKPVACAPGGCRTEAAARQDSKLLDPRRSVAVRLRLARSGRATWERSLGNSGRVRRPSATPARRRRGSAFVTDTRGRRRSRGRHSRSRRQMTSGVASTSPFELETPRWISRLHDLSQIGIRRQQALVRDRSRASWTGCIQTTRNHCVPVSPPTKALRAASGLPLPR
jgi:hypothetical protein